ncbi:MAG: hypothetical protein ACREM1_12215 [Longimicrobiales bacterium]
MRDERQTPGLDAFWEQADVEASDEHPLERELSHRIDAIARYGGMIADAAANGFDDMVSQLGREQAREETVAQRLRRALQRGR